MKPRGDNGFTLIEILTVIAIIGVLATVTIVATVPALRKGRDTKRKATISQVGKFLAGGTCFVPDAGVGDYDLGEIFPEVVVAYPQIEKYVKQAPRDPSGGTPTVTKYRYVVDAEGDCALYANLEYRNENMTLESLTAPTPGGGTGVLQGDDEGVNGTDIYFQASN